MNFKNFDDKQLVTQFILTAIDRILTSETIPMASDKRNAIKLLVDTFEEIPYDPRTTDRKEEMKAEGFLK